MSGQQIGSLRSPSRTKTAQSHLTSIWDGRFTMAVRNCLKGPFRGAFGGRWGLPSGLDPATASSGFRSTLSLQNGAFSGPIQPCLHI